MRPIIPTLATHSELYEHWPFIRSGLASVRADLEGQSFWEPEHIRAAIEASNAAEARGEATVCQLWLGRYSKDEPPRALMVTQMMFDQFLHIPLTLFVWIVYKHPSHQGDLITECEGPLIEYARARGCRTLECMTAHPRFATHLEARGWTTAMRVLRKPLWPTASEHDG